VKKVEAARARLARAQALIRDEQRDRIDQIHALCHEAERDLYRTHLGYVVSGKLELPGEPRSHRWTQVHVLVHAIMLDFDRAVLIHEAKSRLEGTDPREVSRALWPVRTKPTPDQRGDRLRARRPHP